MAIRVSFCSSPPAFAFGGILKEGPYDGSDVGEGLYGRTRYEIYSGTLPGVVYAGREGGVKDFSIKNRRRTKAPRFGAEKCGLDFQSRGRGRGWWQIAVRA